MHLYDELNEIKIPDNAHSDGVRVYINYDIGNGKTKKLYIGQFANKAEKTFYANENFRLYCPNEWAAAYGKVTAPHYRYNVGMYVATLMITHNINLYSILHDSFGPLYGNAILDYAMYSIMERSNVAYRFKPAMEHQFIFSKDRKDDDWLRDVFSSLVTIDMIQDFRIRWLNACKTRGILKVWISIDGSNSDNECTTSELSMQGENKSKTNKNCIGYMVAVGAEDGTPVTYSVYYGDEVDSKAVVEMIEFLTNNGIEVLGVILDRGFLTEAVIKLINDKHLNYVIMLKSDTFGHTQMVIDYGESIYWNISYLVGEDGLFGISDGPRKIFKDYDVMGYINLYFDAKNGSDRKVTFVNKLYAVITALQEAIDEGKTPVVPKEYRKYLKIESISDSQASSVEPPIVNETGTQKSTEDDENQQPNGESPCGNHEESSTTQSKKQMLRIVATEQCNKQLYKKGFQSIATSQNYGPALTDFYYHLRNTSEVTYRIMKSMVGFHVFRVHTTEGVQSRGAVWFVTSIIRNEIDKACKSLGQKTSIMLPLIERPSLALMTNRTYKYIDDIRSDVSKFFEHIGCKKEDFETIAGEVNEREQAQNGKGVSQYHRTPDEIRKAHKRIKEAHKKKNQVDEAVPETTNDDVKIEPARRPGRPLGRKNNKTLDKEAAQASQDQGDPPVKKKAGRPKGRKNNKTLEKEAAGIIPKSKRKRGRPAGSKDSKPRHRRTKQEIEDSRAEKNQV